MEVAGLVTGSHDQSVSITICLETVATIDRSERNSETMTSVISVLRSLVKRLGNTFRRKSVEILPVS